MGLMGLMDLNGFNGQNGQNGQMGGLMMIPGRILGYRVVSSSSCCSIVKVALLLGTFLLSCSCSSSSSFPSYSSSLFLVASPLE